LGAPAQAIASDSTNTYVVDNTGALYYGANSSFSTLSALSQITLTGPGSLTTFGSAVGGLVSDGSGKLYVADSGNHQIYTLTLDSLSLPTSGTFTVLAGSGVSGSWDGQGTSATFSSLPGITRDGTTGYLFVSDGNLIRKITPSGTVTTVAGRSVAGSSNGSGTAANFASPKGLTMGQDGELYVADSGNALIRRLKIK
jgi:sugar lactone lactonase YvrE